jgi:phosphoglycerol transferase
VILCAVVATYDQRVISGWMPHESREGIFRADAEFVRQVEADMPQDAMVFQLPFTDFPVENLVERMFNNDQGRPYVHSKRLRWTWGAVTGTTPAEWNRRAAAQPIREMLHTLSQRGFSGIWVDLFGYNAQTSPESQLTGELAVTPLRSANGRYLFYDMRSYSARHETAESAWNEAQKRSGHPVELTFERGFYDDEPGGAQSLMSSRKRGRLVLINPLETERTVELSTTLETRSDRPRNIRIEAGGLIENLPVTRALLWSRTLTLPPGGQIPVSFYCVCDRMNGTGSRPAYFRAADIKVEER